MTTSFTTPASTIVEHPLSPTIGAELHGVDLREELSDETIADIRGALLRWKVIFFRDQPLTVEQHIAFARRFGALEIHPASPKSSAHPEVLRIEHGPESRGRENNWHSDVTWREAPSLGSVLRAVEVPPVGGDPLLLRQVFDNLVNNALQAMNNGGTLTVELSKVSHPDLGVGAELLIRDTGEGMDTVVRSRALDPFFTTRLGQGGSGLGLSIVLNLVRDLLGLRHCGGGGDGGGAGKHQGGKAGRAETHFQLLFSGLPPI